MTDLTKLQNYLSERKYSQLNYWLFLLKPQNSVFRLRIEIKTVVGDRK